MSDKPYKLINPVPTQLYRHYDEQGVLLYVGISLSAVSRLSGHRTSGARWFEQIARVDIETFKSRRDAERAEREAIQWERPLYNIVHARDSGEDRQAHITRLLVVPIKARTDYLAMKRPSDWLRTVCAPEKPNTYSAGRLTATAKSYCRRHRIKYGARHDCHVNSGKYGYYFDVDVLEECWARLVIKDLINWTSVPLSQSVNRQAEADAYFSARQLITRAPK